MILRARQRKSIEVAIRETCQIRKWALLAINIRTNHVHTVVTANRAAEPVLTAFKANATRQLREDGFGCTNLVPGHGKAANENCGTNKALRKLSTMCFMDRVTTYRTLMIECGNVIAATLTHRLTMLCILKPDPTLPRNGTDSPVTVLCDTSRRNPKLSRESTD